MLILKKYVGLLAMFLAVIPGLVQAAEVGNFKLSYEDMAFTASTTLTVTSTPLTGGWPWQWSALTPAYDFAVSSVGAYNPGQPFGLKINYGSVNNYEKQIFIYDDYSASWEPITTTDDPKNKTVSATIEMPVGRAIVLFNPDVLTVGWASWYKFKGGLFAASPDFTKGSTLRVYNIDTNKSIDVTVNDWGPDRSKHPDRVVDLDYQAFQKIADTGSGLVKVRIEPLKATPTSIKPEQTPTQINTEPIISAPAAVIMTEKDGRVLWSKEAGRVSPLASLTKLVAIRTFLDTKPKLSKVVAYDQADEAKNYLYCRPGESSRLKLKNGDKLTIENLIYSSLVGSTNNTIETLVRVSGLSRDAFISRMNKNVQAWGATNTKFIEPTGLSPKNVSSPSDYAIITKAIFTTTWLQKVSTTRRYTFKTVNTKQTHTLSNTNELLGLNKYAIIGSKTGYLKEAGHCLMTRVVSPQGNLIVVNFGSPTAAANFSDNEQLIRYGLRIIGK
jgi:D-alanyl-D-alanine endopeptidase (penicillin-binding protein 7)